MFESCRAHFRVSDERLDEQHVDAACAWLNVENGVLHRIAEDDFSLDETALAVDLHERARKFLVDGLGEDGEAIYRRFSGADLPEGSSEADVAQRMRETFGKPSFELGCYLAASKWSLEGILREAGADEKRFRTVRDDTSARLRGVIGEQKANRARELTEEFLEALRS
jgi:hypothetical protein